MPTQHAKHFSASSSARWLNCTKSVQLYDEAPKKEQTSSFFAQEGTCAHEVADLCLRTNKSPSDWVDKTVEGIEVTKEMAEYVQQYLDYIASFEKDSTILFPEQKVDYSDYVPEGFGTSDAILIDPTTNTCHIFDLKYGKGISVSAVENTQAQLYAIGVLSDYGYIHQIDSVMIHIVQPRTGNFSYWERTPEQLHQFGLLAQSRAQEAFTDDAVFAPSDKACQWCDFKGQCKALMNHTHNIIAQDFDDLTIDHEQVDLMTDKELVLIHTNAKLIRGFLEAVESHIKQQLECGHPFEGYKLVEGRSIRKLKPEADDYFKDNDEAWSTKLKPLGELEKLVGKKAFAELDLTTKPPGKPTVVPESDKRASIDVTQDFEAIK